MLKFALGYASVLVFLQCVEDVLNEQDLPSEVDLPQHLALTRLDPHRMEVLTKHPPLVLVLDQVADRIEASFELGSLEPVLHDGGKEDHVSEPLLMLG